MGEGWRNKAGVGTMGTGWKLYLSVDFGGTKQITKLIHKTVHIDNVHRN